MVESTKDRIVNPGLQGILRNFLSRFIDTQEEDVANMIGSYAQRLLHNPQFHDALLRFAQATQLGKDFSLDDSRIIVSALTAGDETSDPTQARLIQALKDRVYLISSRLTRACTEELGTFSNRLKPTREYRKRGVSQQNTPDIL